MKRVWIINHYAAMPNEAGGTRHYQLGAALANNGWDVCLFAASTNHKSGKQRRLSLPETSPENFEVDLIPTNSYGRNGILRIFNMVFFSLNMLIRNLIATNKPDVVIGSTVHPFAALSAYWLSKVHGAKFVYEIRDLWPETLIELGKIGHRSIVTQLLRKLDFFLFNKATKVLFLIKSGSEYYAKYGFETDKCLYVPNGVEKQKVTITEDFADKEKFIVLYLGGMSPIKNLETLINCRAIIANKHIEQSKKIRVDIVGDGPSKSELVDLKNSLRLTDEQLRICDSVPKHSVQATLSEANILVVLNRDLPRLYRYGIGMNKLFDYMLAKKPIIIASPTLSNPIEDAECGVTVEPENPERLANEILRMSRLSDEEMTNLGNNAFEFVCKYHDINGIAKRLSSTLDECCLRKNGKL